MKANMEFYNAISVFQKRLGPTCCPLLSVEDAIPEKHMLKRQAKYTYNLLKEAFSLFKENHPVKFASAIAYFSLFALPCIFLIITHVLGLVLDRHYILAELEQQLQGVVGEDGAAILVDITKNYGEKAAESGWTVALYTVIVFWLSTQLFRLFQNSLNDLWCIKPDFKNVLQKFWVERGKTFVLVLATGIMFYASLGVKWLMQLLLGQVLGVETDDTVLQIVVAAFTVVLVYFWFALLYKEVPAMRLPWGPTFVGAAMTTVLFFAGYWLLWNLVILRDLEEFYAEVTSIVRVALWVFYSSLVFLYGASLTRAYAQHQRTPVEPASYAYSYRIKPD
jgi:membrane protein